jgi:acyl-CoA synthetase (AMP-forming)/AMP-acid ligase II
VRSGIAPGQYGAEIVVFGEHEGAVPYAALFTHGDTPPVVEIDPATDVCVLPYSSGTSGIPKGVMLTHRNLVANLCQMRGPATMLTPDDSIVGVLPFFHIYGMVVIMGAALVEGATIVSLAALRARIVSPRPAGLSHYICERGAANSARARETSRSWPTTI